MPTVETTTLIQAPLDTVYAVARDNSAFPEFMEDVHSLEVVEDDGSRVVSDWVGVVSTFGLKVRWRQEDVWDDTALTCKFKQLQGDYDEMQGEWTFKNSPQGVVFDSVLHYEYRVPGLGPLVGKVMLSLVRKNMENLQEAIKRRAEGQN